MNSMNTISLCRVCLDDNANLPIFESENNEPIHHKLTICLGEKIEDIDGYPRNICTSCNQIIDDLISLINKYKESCKVLENGLEIVIKQEPELENFDDLYIHSEDEVLSDIKRESDLVVDENLSELKPCQVILERVQVNPLKKKSARNKSSEILPKTNSIATSILENKFIWRNMNWCLLPKDKTVTHDSKKKSKLVKRNDRKDPIFKITKKKALPTQKLCDFCGEVFKNQSRLLVHQKSKHFNKPAKCPKCNKTCISSYYLKRHIKRRHEKEKGHVCSQCDKHFAFLGEMKSHQRKVHDKHLNPPKTFKCKLCTKVYKCLKSVLIHERSEHTGDRPAVCNVCSSSFYHEDYLKEHMRLHTGETPFKCPICGRGYAQRGNMKSHLRNHKISELDSATLSKLRPSYLKRMKL